MERIENRTEKNKKAHCDAYVISKFKLLNPTLAPMSSRVAIQQLREKHGVLIGRNRMCALLKTLGVVTPPNQHNPGDVKGVAWRRKIMTSFGAEPDQFDEIKRLALKNKVTVSEQIRVLIEGALEEYSKYD